MSYLLIHEDQNPTINNAQPLMVVDQFCGYYAYKIPAEAKLEDLLSQSDEWLPGVDRVICYHKHLGFDPHVLERDLDAPRSWWIEAEFDLAMCIPERTAITLTDVQYRHIRSWPELVLKSHVFEHRQGNYFSEEDLMASYLSCCSKSSMVARIQHDGDWVMSDISVSAFDEYCLRWPSKGRGYDSFHVNDEVDVSYNDELDRWTVVMIGDDEYDRDIDHFHIKFYYLGVPA